MSMRTNAAPALLTHEEHALLFDCAGEQSVGIVSLPTEAVPAETGLLIVVGGPQYRVGSHRLFVKLARHVASQGHPAMRFDYRGMGDSLADARDFEAIGDDLRSAIDAFFEQVPSMQGVILWGLCDGASAACLYAPRDPRVAGLILVNPWVHTATGGAVTRLRHYYLRRLLEPGFWRKMLSGRVKLHSLQVLIQTVGRSFEPRAADPVLHGLRVPASDAPQNVQPLPSRTGLHVWDSGAPIAIALSEHDEVAREFEDQAMPTPPWREALSTQLVKLARLPGADHTVTSPEASAELCRLTAGWMRELRAGQPPGRRQALGAKQPE